MELLLRSSTTEWNTFKLLLESDTEKFIKDGGIEYYE